MFFHFHIGTNRTVNKIWSFLLILKHIMIVNKKINYYDVFNTNIHSYIILATTHIGGVQILVVIKEITE